jgi:hypothetical protein
VDSDGYDGLVCAFVQPDTGLELDSTEAWLRGRSSIGAALDVRYESLATELEPFPDHLIPSIEDLR